MAKRVRYWDLAASKDGAFTCGVKMSLDNGIYYVEGVTRGQWTPHERDLIILQTARLDGIGTTIYIEQEPGSAGKSLIHSLIRLLAGFAVYADRPTGDKQVRAEPFAAQAEAGNVRLVHGSWNGAYIEELTSFPNGKYKDQVDASSGAFNKLRPAKKQKIRSHSLTTYY